MLRIVMRFERTMVLSLAFCLTLVTLVQGHSEYLQRIPNAYSVKTEDGSSFLAIGHVDSAGNGARNRFGADFKTFGLNWNDQICRADSDGDGLTNGYELGDPDCKWKSGDTPTRITDITHPGICQPKDSAACQAAQQQPVNCDPESSSEDCEEPMTTSPTTSTDSENSNTVDNGTKDNTVNGANAVNSANQGSDKHRNTLEKTKEWTKASTILVAIGAIAFFILVGIIVKLVIYFVK